MKKLSIICLLILAGLIAKSQDFKYEYDANGNRIKRQIIPLKSMQTNHDSTASISTDTAAIANNMSNAANNSGSNTNSNEGATGTSQYSENFGEQQIVIYPNPTTGSLRIKITPFNSSAQGEITVFDMQSHLLIKESCTKELTVIDLSKYARGSYILKVSIGNVVKEWKVVKE